MNIYQRLYYAWLDANKIKLVPTFANSDTDRSWVLHSGQTLIEN